MNALIIYWSGADSAEIGHLSAPNRVLVRANRPPHKERAGSGAGMAIV